MKNKKGFTLLELLLVLIIITSIIIIAARYYNQASSESKLSDLTAKIRRIAEASYEWVQTAKAFNSSDPNGKTLSISTLQNSKLLSTNDANNPWGSSLEVIGISANVIQITVPVIPTKNCKSLEDNLVSQNMTVTCTPSTKDADQSSSTIKYPADET